MHNHVPPTPNCKLIYSDRKCIRSCCCVGDGGRSGKKGWLKDMQKLGGGDKYVCHIDCVVGAWIHIFVHIKTYQTVPFGFFCHATGSWDISSPIWGLTWALAMKELSPNHWIIREFSKVYTLNMCCFFYVTNTLKRYWKKRSGGKAECQNMEDFESQNEGRGWPSGVMGSTGQLQIEFGLEESTLVGRARNSPGGAKSGQEILFFFLTNLAVPGLSCDMWVLVPWPGIKPGLPALWAIKSLPLDRQEVPGDSCGGGVVF